MASSTDGTAMALAAGVAGISIESTGSGPVWKTEVESRIQAMELAVVGLQTEVKRFADIGDKLTAAVDAKIKEIQRDQWHDSSRS